MLQLGRRLLPSLGLSVTLMRNLLGRELLRLWQLLPLSRVNLGMNVLRNLLLGYPRLRLLIGHPLRLSAEGWVLGSMARLFHS